MHSFRSVASLIFRRPAPTSVFFPFTLRSTPFVVTARRCFRYASRTAASTFEGGSDPNAASGAFRTTS